MLVVDCGTVWNDCLRVIQDNVAEQSFITWFKPIKPYKLEDKVLTIQVPSQFFYEWLEEHYVHVLKRAIDAVMGPGAKLSYSVVVDQGGNSGAAPYTINLPNNQNRKQTSNNSGPNYNSPFELKSVDSVFQSSQLNDNYTFDSYIEGDCNRLARSAGQAVAQKPGITSFNPLMLYGGVGLGKTHLVQAIGNEIKENLPDKFVLYVSSEKFTNQFMDAVKNNKIQEFQNFYLQVDILIIDDVQFLSGKEKTQEIFFHIFNHLHQAGKQIVMTSDCPPRDLKGLQERLLSRFKWGLTADIQQPDLETRIAIIHKKMEEDGINISEDVIEYLAYSVDTNIRELEGVIISLIAHSSLNRAEIDLELAKQTLKNIIEDIETEVGVDYIQKTIAEYFHLKVDDLKDKIRKKEIVIARQTAMYFCKEYTNHSLKSIGYHFGGRDHSTVIHAVQTVNDMMDTDANYKNSVEELRNKLKMKAI
ncbi:MAG: chromosomal replication initiator protein DnaA [Cyclobacteriaceae bacterium]|nr:chromosomal replication initiator protein DnaA [Cyclobacteriaceae bacterium]